MVAARYIKSQSWPAAIDILYNVAQSLLQAGQGGSGGDLSLFLIDVYRQAELKPDSSSKGKLLTLLRLFDSEEPTRKKFVDNMIGYILSRVSRTKLTGLVGLRHVVNTQLESQNYTMLPDHYTQRSTRHTRQKDILRLERKIHRKFLRSWNTNGTHKTTHTPRLCTLHGLSSHTSSTETCAMLRGLYSYSQAD